MKFLKNNLKSLCIILVLIFGFYFIYNSIKDKRVNEEQLEPVDASVKDNKYLYDEVAKQAVLDNISSKNVKDKNGINFAQPSSDTNGNGVYTIASTQDIDYPIHYYRGMVENNNVLFADRCWQIVRTTETGGVKIIYNGVAHNNNCIDTTGKYIDTRYATGASSIANVGYMYGDIYNIKTTNVKGKSIKFGYRIKEYYSDTGQYVIGGDSKNTSGNSNDWESDRTMIDNHRYTCLTTSDKCTTLYYIHYADKNGNIFYVELSDGEFVGKLGETVKLDKDLGLLPADQNIMEKMLSNKNDSEAKKEVDKWFNYNMTNYIDWLEDTVFCNDREITTYNGWSPTTISNGDSILNEYMYFASYNRVAETHTPTLKCKRSDDKFTVSADIGNGLLKYPVGLLTADEAIYAGGIHDTGSDYWLSFDRYSWLMSPYYFDGDSRATTFNIESNGNVDFRFVELYQSSIEGQENLPYVVRPVISLKDHIMYSEGDGTKESPYVIVEA